MGLGRAHTNLSLGRSLTDSELGKAQFDSGLGTTQFDSGLGTAQIESVHSKEKTGLGKAQLVQGLLIHSVRRIIPVRGMDQTQALSSGVVCGPGQCRNKGVKALNIGTRFKGKCFSGHASKRNATKLLAKIKPKKITCFEHRNILSSQDQELVQSKNFLQRGHCSLRRSLRPINKERDCLEECLSLHQCGNNIEFCGESNYAATSQIIEDIEIDSDGEALCFNMTFSSSSSATDEEVRDEANSQSSGTNENQTDNQLANLEDVRLLFNESQEMPVNFVQVSNSNSNFLSNREFSFPQPLTIIHPPILEYNINCETGKRVDEAKVLEEPKGEDIVERNMRAEGGKQLTEGDVCWESIEEMVQNMGFCLVPSQKVKFQEEKRVKVGKKGRKERFEI